MKLFCNAILRMLFCGCFLLISVDWEAHGETPNTPKTEDSTIEPEPLPLMAAPPKPQKFFSPSDSRVKAHGGRISLRHLDLTRPPSEEELRQCGQLGSPLSPSHSADPKKIEDRKQRKAQEDDNLLFGQAMQQWNEHHYGDAVMLFKKHREAFLDSPWAGEAQLHLGCQAQFSGDWETAKYSFEWILGNQKKGIDIWQKAKLRRAVLHYEQGELDSATAAFGEMLTTETNWERKTYAQDWLLRLNQLKAHQTALRVCGRESIVCVLESRGDKERAKKAKMAAAPGERGFSLGELQRFAHEMSLPAIAIRSEIGDLDQLPCPFVAHYKDEHFVTVIGMGSADTIRIFDSRLGRVTELNKEQFIKQWSGLALIFDAVPKGVKLASAIELEQEVGGCCGVPKPESDLGDDCNKSCTTCGRGMPEWSVNPVNMNLVVQDIPMWLDSPVGPKMEIRLTYNSQDALNQYRPFGNKWSFNYASYAMESPASTITGSTYSEGSVLIIMPDGRRDVYTPLQAYSSGQIGTYTTPEKVFNKLEKVGDYDWNLTFPDGTVYHYGVPPTMMGNSATSLLLSITDRYGSALTISHYSNGHIETIANSQGYVFGFYYNGDGTVSKVEDSFGRKALFSYTNGNLTGQTDMGELSYSYSYDANVYLTSIGKPSGTWLFYIEPADGINNGSNAYPQPGGAMWQNYRITITNPINYKEEYYYNGYSSCGWHRDANQYASQLNALNAPKTRYEYTSHARGGEAVVSRTVYAAGTSISGTVTLSDFDENYQPGATTDENNHTKYASYNDQGMVLTSTNARNFVTTYTYQDYGSENENNGRDLNTISHANQLVKEITRYTDPASKSYRNIKTITEPVTEGLVQTTEFTYNNFGQIQTKTLPDGTVQTYWYKNDGSHQLEKITQGPGDKIIQSFTYDGIGRVESVTNQDGITQNFQYDDLNRITRVTYPDNTFEETIWGCCVVERTIDRNGQSTWYFYDRSNRLRIKRDPAGNLTRLAYDPVGNLTQLVDGKNQTTRWVYNARNRVSDKIFADNTTLHCTYDNVGNLLTVTDAYQRTTKYDYDANNNLEFITSLGTGSGITPVLPPDIAQIHFTYDAFDRRESMTDGLATTTWGYAGAGKNTSITVVASGTDSISLGYDSFGRNTSRTVNGASVASHFDAAGRLQWMATQSGTYHYVYPEVSGSIGALTTKVASITYPNGQVTAYEYEPDTGRLQTLWNKTNGGDTLSKFDYQYDSAGQIANWEQKAGAADPVAYDFDYDANYQLAGAILKNVQTGATQKRYEYGYDLAGNRIAETIDNSVTRDDHNNLNQLIQHTTGGAIPFRGTSSKPLSSVTVNSNPATITGGTNFSAVLQVASGTNTVTVIAKDQSNPILSSTNQYAVTVTSGTSTTREFNYDLNGNLTGDGVRIFEWDSRNRLTAVNQGLHRTEFTYDGLNRRVGIVEKENGVQQSSKRLVWAGLDIVEERNGMTNALNKQYSMAEMTIATGTNTVTYFYTLDHLGSVRELTDASGSVRARYNYDPYGRRSLNQITANPVEADFGYTRHYEHIASGLTLAPYRAYDASLGRWLSRDPFGSMMSRQNAEMFGSAALNYYQMGISQSEMLPDGPNLYRYLGGNPINDVDSEGEFGLAGALGGGAFSIGSQFVKNGGLSDLMDGRFGDAWDKVTECTDWADVGISAASGALFGGAAGNAFKAAKGYYTASQMGNTAVVYTSKYMAQSIMNQVASNAGRAAANAAAGAAATAAKRAAGFPRKKCPCK